MIKNKRPKIRIVSLKKPSPVSAARSKTGNVKTDYDCDAYEIPNPPWPPCSAQCVDQSDTPPCDCVDQSDTPPCDCVDQSDTPPCDCVDQSDSLSLRSKTGGKGRQRPKRGKPAARTFFKVAAKKKS